MRFTALLLTLLAFAAQPAAAASSPTMSNLEQRLSYLVAGKSADVGIAALDLNSGETVSIKGNTPFPMASTVKVAVAIFMPASVTLSVKVELVAVQEAATSAVTWPAALTAMLLMVTPVPVSGVAVTIKVLSGWSGSLTVAI